MAGNLIFLLLLLHTQFHRCVASMVAPASHSCTSGDDRSRICRFTNLTIFDGQLLYISDDVKSVPRMSGYMQGYESYGPDIQVLTTAAAEKLLAGAKQGTDITEGMLVFRMHHENWGHHMLDITATTHRILCSSLKRCTYDPEDLSTLWLIFTDHFPRHTGNFQRIWGCYSSNPPLYLKKAPSNGQVTVVRTAVAGWAPLGLFTSQWDPPSAQTYHDRLWRCVGLDSKASVAQLQPPVVTIVQRPYGESRKARSFVNAHEVLPSLQAAFPNAVFRVERMLDKSFEEMVGVFHNSSVVVAANGAAMGNAVFMRRGACYVDVGPAQWHFTFLTWVFGNLGKAAQVQVINHSVKEPRHAPVRWEVVAAMPQFQQLTKEQMLRLIRYHECPAGPLEGFCKADWLYTKTDYVLDPEKTRKLVDQALKGVRGFKA